MFMDKEHHCFLIAMKALILLLTMLTLSSSRRDFRLTINTKMQ